MKEQENKGTNETKNGKVVLLIVIAIIAIALIVTGIVFAINANKPKSNVQITSAEDMQNLISNVYSGIDVQLPPSLNTQVIDINNADVLKAYTGLSSNENIDAVVASEPMVGSQAYSYDL